MQHADQREEPPGGIVVELDLALERIEQQPRAAVVNPAPRHVERLEFLRRGLAQRLVVAVADGEIFAHRAAKARQAEADRPGIAAVLVAQRNGQPPVDHRQIERPRPGVTLLDRAQRREVAVDRQIVQRRRAFLLDLGPARKHGRFVEYDRSDAILRHGRSCRRPGRGRQAAECGRLEEK